MIVTEITQNLEHIGLPKDQIKQLIKDICQRFNISDATVSLAIVDDDEIAELNSRFLNHNHTTDCISFDLSDREDKKNSKLFDIIVNAELADRQAKLRDHSTLAELALYITHGMLHNLGFDDKNAEQAEEMHRMEDQILQKAGFGSVYNHDENEYKPK